MSGGPLRLAVAVALMAGCASRSSEPARRVGAPAPSAGDLLPGDLDVVVRIDWPRLRSSPLDARARQALSGAGLPRELGLLGSVLDGSRAVLIGVRILSDGFHGDGVLAIEGDDASLDPDVLLPPGAPGFRSLPAPPGVAMFARSGGCGRGEAELVVVLPHRGILVATPSEADAVRRTAESGADADRLDPPARGVASFAGRVRPGGGDVLPGPGGRLLRRVATGLVAFSGTVELGEGLALESDLVYASAEDAENGEKAVGAAVAALEALGPSPRRVARSTRWLRRDRLVTLRTAIAIDALTAMP